MTFEQWAMKELIECGMFKAQAAAVLAQYKAETTREMDRWQDRIEDYPVAMRAVLWLGIERAALAWIDANLPRAFFRPMFLPPEERAALFAGSRPAAT